MLTPIVLKNDFLSIEPVSMQWLDDFHEYSVKEKLYDYLEFKPFQSIDETRTYLQKLMKRSAKNTTQYWFIRLIDEDKVVGSVGLHGYDPVRQSIEIGYGVSPDYWGQGVFRSAALLLIEYVFDDLGIHRLVARTASENEASIRGLEKLKFKREGIMRDYYKFSNGNWHDAILLSRLSTD
jgi:ribosomal-protein-alanine N-acetyltransferase